MKRYLRLIVCIATIIFMVGTTYIPSYGEEVPEQERDYILGRPMTEEEIAKQKELIPDNFGYRSIDELNTESREVEGKTIEPVNPNDLINDESAQKKARSSAKSLPAKLDPRELTWYKNNIQVRDQRNAGLCWAYSAATMAEISMAKKGYATKPLYSPVHFGYFFYHRVDDPLGNTSGDGNKFTDRSANFASMGGDENLAYQAIAGWTGIADDSIAPYDKHLEDIDRYPYVKVKSKPSNSIAYKNSAILKEAKFLTTDEEIKEAVKDYGAVCMSYNYNERYDDQETAAYYDSKLRDPNHAVTVVGWDDNYSRYNFNGGRNIPNSDGAWIVQNSWGEGYGDGGYFYLSYESKSMESRGIVLDFVPQSTYDYNYQYDGTANQASITLEKNDKVANVFTVKKSQKGKTQYLKGVGFSSFGNRYYKDKDTVYPSTYNIKVYTNIKSSLRPEEGTLALEMKNVNISQAGYYTVELSKPVNIGKSTRYAIVVESVLPSTKYNNQFCIDETYTHPKSYIHFINKMAEGQSVLYDCSADKWRDMATTYDCTARIKGLVDEVEEKHIGDVTLNKSSFTYSKHISGKDPVKFSYYGTTLKKDQDYTVVKKVGCDRVGYGKIYIKGTGAYAAETSKRYAIRPDGTTVTKVKRGKRQFTVKWKSQKKKMSTRYIAGYQIAYSTKSSMSGAKYKKVSGYKSTCKTIKNLKKKKKYYVKVRTYMKGSNGQTFYSDWSNRKSVTTR